MIFQYLLTVDRKVGKIAQFVDFGGFQPASTIDSPPEETVSTPPPDEPEIKIPPKETVTPSGVIDIKDLRVGQQSSKDSKINVKGTLKFDPIQRDVDTRSGPNTVTNLTIEDGTGDLKLAFWGNAGEPFMDFVKGDMLFIENVYKIKEPYGSNLQYRFIGHFSYCD